MISRETGRDNLPSVKIKVLNELRYRLSNPETVREDHKPN